MESKWNVIWQSNGFSFQIGICLFHCRVAKRIQSEIWKLSLDGLNTSVFIIDFICAQDLEGKWKRQISLTRKSNGFIHVYCFFFYIHFYFHFHFWSSYAKKRVTNTETASGLPDFNSLAIPYDDDDDGDDDDDILIHNINILKLRVNTYNLCIKKNKNKIANTLLLSEKAINFNCSGICDVGWWQ